MNIEELKKHYKDVTGKNITNKELLEYIQTEINCAKQEISENYTRLKIYIEECKKLLKTINDKQIILDYWSKMEEIANEHTDTNR